MGIDNTLIMYGGVVNFGSFLFGFCAPQGRSILGFNSGFRFGV